MKALRDINPAGGTASPTAHQLPPRAEQRHQHLRPRLSRRHAILRPRPQRRRRHARYRSGARAEPDPDRPLRRDRRPALGHQRGPHGPRQLHARRCPPPPDRRSRPARARRRAVRRLPGQRSASRRRSASILQKRDRKSIAMPEPGLGRISRRILRRPADRQRRPPRAVLHPRAEQLLLHARARRASSNASARMRPEACGEQSPSFARSIRPIQGPQQRKFKYDKIAAEPRLRSTTSPDRSASSPATPRACRCRARTISTTASSSRPTRKRPSPSRKPPTASTAASAIAAARSRRRSRCWKTKFNNRTASAFDPELNQSVFRNLGSVDKWGIDGSIAYKPIRQLTRLRLRRRGTTAKIKDNIQVGTLATGRRDSCDRLDARPVTLNFDGCGSRAAAPITSGNRESGAPKYTYGFSALGSLGPVDLGITAKRTGPRYHLRQQSGDVPRRRGLPGHRGRDVPPPRR